MCENAILMENWIDHHLVVCTLYGVNSELKSIFITVSTSFSLFLYLPPPLPLSLPAILLIFYVQTSFSPALYHNFQLFFHTSTSFKWWKWWMALRRNQATSMHTKLYELSMFIIDATERRYWMCWLLFRWK